MILIDTSAFFAVINADDLHHPYAKEFWFSLIEEDISIFCNNYVLSETIALLQNRIGIRAVHDFHENVKPFLEIEWLGEEEHNFAMSLLFSANRGNLSLVDISAFATMRRLGISKVFTFDRHFAEEGFDMLPAL